MKFVKRVYDFLKYLNSLPAIRITLFYVIFGLSWILLSDKFLILIVKDPVFYNEMQTYKGWFYILLTAFLLYHLVSDSFSRLSEMREDLDENEIKYRTIFENYRDVYFELDSKGVIIEVSPSIKDHYGFDRQDVIGKKLANIICIDNNQINIFNYLFKNKRNEDIEITLYSKSGEKRYCSVNSELVTDLKNNIKVIGSLHDITDRKKNELYLKKMSIAVEQSPSITLITDPQGIIEYVNPRFTEITGYTEEEIIGRNPRVLKAIYKDEDYYKELWETICSGEVWQGLLFNKTKAGDRYFESAFISPLKDVYGDITHFIKVANDVTNLRNIEENLRKSLNEKDALLQELYHRTKNNMQLISSILKMEERFAAREEIKPFSRSINNRIMAMSIIHDRIYQNTDINSVDLKKYLMGFIPYLLQDYKVANRDVSLKLSISEITLSANTSIAIGLLLNEMVGISLYDQPDNPCTSLEIGFIENEKTKELYYKDNNKQLICFLKEEKASLSGKLIAALVRQLNGKISFEDATGKILISVGNIIQKTFNEV